MKLFKNKKTEKISPIMQTYYNKVTAYKIEEEIIEILRQKAKLIAREIVEKYDIETIFEQEELDTEKKLIIVLTAKEEE